MNITKIILYFKDIQPNATLTWLLVLNLVRVSFCHHLQKIKNTSEYWQLPSISKQEIVATLQSRPLVRGRNKWIHNSRGKNSNHIRKGGLCWEWPLREEQLYNSLTVHIRYCAHIHVDPLSATFVRTPLYLFSYRDSDCVFIHQRWQSIQAVPVLPDIQSGAGNG